jgi:hypothetical protein
LIDLVDATITQFEARGNNNEIWINFLFFIYLISFYLKFSNHKKYILI